MLRHLALAGTAEGDLSDIVHATWSVAGGLVVAAVADAAVADADGAALDRLAAARPPGTTGVLLLLDAATFAGAPPSPGAAGRAHRLRAAGWRSTVVRAGQPVADAWATACYDDAWAVAR